MFEQVKRRKVSVEDKINTKERNNILEKLNRPCNWNGWELQDASEDLQRDSEIVMASVKQYGNALEFSSEDIQKDREIVMAAVNHNVWALRLLHRIFGETGRQ